MFGDLLEQGGIDLMLSGHTHRYGIHLSYTDHSYPVMIGGGPMAGNRTLIKITCTRENLHATMVKDDGEVIGELNIKPKKKR